MTILALLLWSILYMSCNASVNVIITAPASLSHGRSLPPLHAHTASSSATTAAPGAVGNSVVNQRVSELRAGGQNSPAGLPVTTISIADSFASLPVFHPHPVYVDSLSVFNVASEVMYQQIRFPVGDECCVTVDNSKTTDCGNFAVLTVQIHQASADMIFCYIPGQGTGIVNLDFLKHFDLGNGTIDKC